MFTLLNCLLYAADSCSQPLQDSTIALHARLLLLPHPVNISAAASTITCEAPLPHSWTVRFGRNTVRAANTDADKALAALQAEIARSKTDKLRVSA
jgi:hypothetical protein